MMRLRSSPYAAVFAVGTTILLVSLVRTAWLSDDSYISFRTADNIIHGYGPVWNVDERVQAFTHPLWLAVCTLAFALTGNVYYTAIALGILLAVASVLLLALRLVSTPWNLTVCFAALLSSKAFIDFSTSGLENGLTHLLLFAFVWRWWEEPEGVRRVQRLSVLACLCLLNRIDLAPLLAPPLVYEAWRLGPRASLRPLLVGFLPFIAWEVFSTFYYGTPFPNTAYAKLNAAMSTSMRLQRGVDYVYRTLTGDPVTLPVIGLAAMAVPAARRWLDWPLLAGFALYGAYVMRVGGDFMMGRFFSGPFVIGVALIARAPWAASRRPALITAATVLVLGLLAPWEPALFSGYGYSYANNLLHGRHTQVPLDNSRFVFVRQVTDERRLNYEFAGLLKVHRGGIIPDHEWSADGLQLRAGGQQVVVRSFIGLEGYFAGPLVHIIDPHALSDPLLARIPGGTSTSIMGHFLREIPDGYIETVKTGTNRLTDPDLAAYYEHLHLVVAGPLWSTRRLVTIALLLVGHYDHYVNDYVARNSRG
jgi:arabinofuranosyltransferase